MESNAANTPKQSTSKPRRNYTNKLVTAALFLALSVILKLTFEIYFLPSLRFNFVTVSVMMSGAVLGPIWGFAVGALTDILNFVIKPSGQAFHYGFTLSSALTGMIPGLIFWLAKRAKKEFKFYGVVNILMYVVLVGGMLLFLNTQDLVTFQDGYVWISGQQIQWYKIIIVLVLFIAYAIMTMFFLRKRENSSWPVPSDKILFAVTSVVIICELLMNTFFLADLLGTTVVLMLPARLIKTVVVIPLFALIMYLLSNVIARNKLTKNSILVK